MINEFKKEIDRVNNIQTTENGGVGYAKSGSDLVDLNFMVPSRHNNINAATAFKFISACDENISYAVKWLFFLRDVREGLGERDSFIKLYLELYKKNPEVAMKVLHLIPEFGRWKDVIDILSMITDSDPLADCIYKMISDQLRDDCINLTQGKSISLLAKWLPSVNSTEKARRVAKRICRNQHIGMIFRDYRKMLSKLRKYIDVTEVKTCGGNWNEIDYNKVSSNANSRYCQSFIKHDNERRTEYLESLKSGKEGVVMHAGNLYPHEVFVKYAHKAYVEYDYNTYNYVSEDPSVEALWNNLKQVEGCGSTMVVCDASGSMQKSVSGNIKAIDVSRSLSIYFSERCEGEYKDKVIEFAHYPSFIDLSECNSLADKFNVMRNHKVDDSSTDIDMVFELLLKTAVSNNMKQEDIPQRVLIVSDMEFDNNVIGMTRTWRRASVTTFEEIQRKWDKYGYTLPELVFWNVNSRTNTIPLTKSANGVKLVSGFSANNIKMILSGELDPWLALKETLDSKRYDIIDECLNS